MENTFCDRFLDLMYFTRCNIIFYVDYLCVLWSIDLTILQSEHSNIQISYHYYSKIIFESLSFKFLYYYSNISVQYNIIMLMA